MLIGVKYVIKQFGSLYECFLKNFNKDDETILPALSMFAIQLAAAGNQGAGQRIFGQCLLSQLDNLLPKQALKPTKRKVVWKKLPHLI